MEKSEDTILSGLFSISVQRKLLEKDKNKTKQKTIELSNLPDKREKMHFRWLIVNGEVSPSDNFGWVELR